MNQRAAYCQECHFPFKQMGACPKPGQSIIWAYISMIPYIIPFIILALTLFTRKTIHLRNFLLLTSCYALGDKILKNIFQSPRPQESCKSSYGMPSSHMAVMTAFCLLRISNAQASQAEKVIWVAITILEGISRMALNYHTLEQVIAGSVYGLVFSVTFSFAWGKTIDLWLRSNFRAKKSDPSSNHIE